MLEGDKVEHLEIASYTGLMHLAKHLGRDDIAHLLQQNLYGEQEMRSRMVCTAMSASLMLMSSFCLLQHLSAGNSRRAVLRGLSTWRAGRKGQMAKRIDVGNLGYDTNRADLERLFTQFGTVRSADVIMERGTDRSKGFSFMEISSDQEATWQETNRPRRLGMPRMRASGSSPHN